MQRWLKLSSAYAESPLRVGCLEWPLRVSASHALQLQVTAALRALNPVKSRHTQVCVCVCVGVCGCGVGVGGGGGGVWVDVWVCGCVI